MINRRGVLIAALSGRGLAELARKAGYRPLVSDLFGDMDTRRYVEAVRVVRGDLMKGPDADDLIAALSDLVQSHGEPPIGLLCGAGFEQRPGLIDELAHKWPLLGCPSDVVKRVKDPASLSRALCRSRYSTSGYSLRQAGRSARLACEKRAAARAAGISPMCSRTRQDDGSYFQKRVPGEAICALVIGTGKGAVLIGWSVAMDIADS